MEKDRLKRTVSSLEFFLNPNVFGDSERKRQISEHLAQGGLVVIKEALEESFAERMFACLDQFADWKLYEGYEKHFHYHHHNIYDEKLFPPDLIRCREIFGSESTKEFMQRLAGRDCMGQITFSASLYSPGDHSLPHDDFLGPPDHHRQVAFVWNLTWRWDPEWGGEFFWCKKNRFVSPSFNSLVLFRVQPHNMHFVTTVSPQAEGKRLAISGWWTGKVDSAADEPAATEYCGDHGVLELI